MLVGVPKEIKADEYRVGLVPSAVRELVAHGHKVLVERGAGTGAGIADAAYESAGAEIVASADQVFAGADLIVKVKEPVGAEPAMLRRGQILFTYLHLAPARALTEALLASGCTAIAYETVTSPNRTLPLLTPMSEVAGRMAPQAGARCLEKEVGGRGMLLGGAPGVAAADVLILGGGVAGTNAALIALGMGAQVTVVDRSPDTLRRLAAQFHNRVRTIFSAPDTVETLCRRADLIIGTVLIPGAAAPKLITAETVRAMKPGAAIVDVSIDQGGCAETSAAHHPFAADLRGRRRCALLRRQHAGRGVAHLDIRAHQRDGAIRAGARGQGAARARRGCAFARRAQRARRAPRAPCRGGGPGLGLSAGGPGLEELKPFWRVF
jgi:alanine dehydrogenase